jgi:hypothetical protein
VFDILMKQNGMGNICYNTAFKTVKSIIIKEAEATAILSMYSYCVCSHTLEHLHKTYVVY